MEYAGAQLAAEVLESLPEDLSLEDLEQHIRALQLEIARSDAAEADHTAVAQLASVPDTDV